MQTPALRFGGWNLWKGQHLLDTGPFALETHAQEIGQLILDFLGNAII